MTRATTNENEDVRIALESGLSLAKCRRCGCMHDALETLQAALPILDAPGAEDLRAKIEGWRNNVQPVEYSCLGCDECLASVALNAFHHAYPDADAGAGLGCAVEVRPQEWPIVPGEYLVMGTSGNRTVAVSTLGSLDLPDQLAALKPARLALVGKTETENIGFDKMIKNVLANPALRYLIVAGVDCVGHYPGATLISLVQKGVNDKMRVIGSPGKRPVLRNVTRDEVEAFRRQIRVIDMIGCADPHAIAARVAVLAGENAEASCDDSPCACHASPAVRPAAAPVTLSASACSCAGPFPEDVLAPSESPATALSACDCNGSCSETSQEPNVTATMTVIQASAPNRIELDRAGYFVIILQRERHIIVTEHYDYDDRLRHTIEGRDARCIYWTIIDSGWISQLSHAAYLGKELAKAELALTMDFKYVQDGA